MSVTVEKSVCFSKIEKSLLYLRAQGWNQKNYFFQGKRSVNLIIITQLVKDRHQILFRILRELKQIN